MRLMRFEEILIGKISSAHIKSYSKHKYKPAKEKLHTFFRFLIKS